MLPGRQKSGRHPFTGISKPDLVLGVSTWAWEQYRKEMFSATLHLMMAAATRYAVGLICDAGVDPEKELELLKDMLMQRFTVSGGRE
jgi:hypothetical protein